MSWTPKTYEELLDAILTDYRNQLPGADTSQGSLIFIRSAALASALWGAHLHQDHISRQIFPDTADPENLEYHAWTRGVTRKDGEITEDLLARLLDYIRRPPAGGTKFDYAKWATSIVNVKSAFVAAPGAQGVGTVDVILFAAADLTGSEIPSAALLLEVKNYIDTVRPVTAKYIRVLAPTFDLQNVTLQGTGVSWNPAACALDVTAYLNSFIVDQVLYLAQLINLAVANGAENVIVTLPAVNTAPVAGHILRPGVINVT